MSVSRLPLDDDPRPDDEPRPDPTGQSGDPDAAPPPPRRLGGDQWWDPDRERHVRDRPRHCPECGHAVGDDRASLIVEYWEDERRVYRVWCRACGFSGDIVRVERVRGHEPSH